MEKENLLAPLDAIDLNELESAALAAKAFSEKLPLEQYAGEYVSIGGVLLAIEEARFLKLANPTAILELIRQLKSAYSALSDQTIRKIENGTKD